MSFTTEHSSKALPHSHDEVQIARGSLRGPAFPPSPPLTHLLAILSKVLPSCSVPGPSHNQFQLPKTLFLFGSTIFGLILNIMFS